MSSISWFAVDWGTSNLRVWAMDAHDQVLKSYKSNQGMLALSGAHAFEAELLGLIDQDLSPGKNQILACGMVGAKQGWIEAPYVAAPCPPPGAENAIQVPCLDLRLSVRILPGVKQTEPADVMRGEETQLAGFLSENPGFEGTILMPGTHTKWVMIEGGSIRSFCSVMTGELFALLSEQSVLKHSVTTTEDDSDAFETGVQDNFNDPAGLMGRFFALRAADLVAGQSAAKARSRLSGLLVGAELRAMAHEWQSKPIALLGRTAAAQQFERALTLLGGDYRVYDTETLTLAGLTAAYRQTA